MSTCSFTLWRLFLVRNSIFYGYYLSVSLLAVPVGQQSSELYVHTKQNKSKQKKIKTSCVLSTVHTHRMSCCILSYFERDGVINQFCSLLFCFNKVNRNLYVNKIIFIFIYAWKSYGILSLVVLIRETYLNCLVKYMCVSECFWFKLILFMLHWYISCVNLY